MRTFDFEIPVRISTLNEWQRMHYRVRGRYGRMIAQYILLAQRPPRDPLKYCRIIIERESTQEPDCDGLKGGVKPLLDALQPVSKRHPYGLGFIAEDNRKCVVSCDVRHVQGKGKRTRVLIEEVAAP